MEEDETENAAAAEGDVALPDQAAAAASAVSRTILSMSLQGVRLPRKRCRDHASYECSKCSIEQRRSVTTETEVATTEEAIEDPTSAISSTTPTTPDDAASSSTVETGLEESPSPASASGSSSSRRPRKSRPFRLVEGISIQRGRMMRHAITPASVPCPPRPAQFEHAGLMPFEPMSAAQQHNPASHHPSVHCLQPNFHCKKQRLCSPVSSSWEPDPVVSTIMPAQGASAWTTSSSDFPPSGARYLKTEEPDSTTHPSIKSEPVCFISSPTSTTMLAGPVYSSVASQQQMYAAQPGAFAGLQPRFETVPQHQPGHQPGSAPAQQLEEYPYALVAAAYHQQAQQQAQRAPAQPQYAGPEESFTPALQHLFSAYHHQQAAQAQQVAQPLPPRPHYRLASHYTPHQAASQPLEVSAALASCSSSVSASSTSTVSNEEASALDARLGSQLVAAAMGGGHSLQLRSPETDGFSKPEPSIHPPPSSDLVPDDDRLPETELSLYKTKMDSVRCGVCGDAAAGFHCGAYVCEACKKFYIRSTKADNANRYQCSKTGQCEISKDTRTHCQYCRYKKCEVLGMYPPGSKPSENSNISVIPCRVCGANSSGFHFGAITCEGCKGFFRRTVNERESNRYQCSKGGQCEITVSTRNNCKSCRYKKCRFVGMSKDGSRIGRQPNAIKHMCAKEIEAIQSCVPLGSQSPLDNFSMRVKAPSALRQELMDEARGKLNCVFLNQVVMASRHLYTMINDKKFSDHYPNRLNKEMKMEEVWDVMMKYFDNHAQHVVDFMREIPGFVELYKKLHPFSKYFVQEAMYPIMLIMLSQSYDVETGHYNYFSFLPCDRDIIMMSFPSFEKIRNHLITSGKLIKNIGLDNTEVAMLCAIELTRNGEAEMTTRVDDTAFQHSTSPVCPDLTVEGDRGNQVTILYDRCVTALEYYIQERAGSRVTLTTITQLQKMLSQMNQEHHSVIYELKQAHPNLKFPNLYMEMFLEDLGSDTGSRPDSIEDQSMHHQDTLQQRQPFQG